MTDVHKKKRDYSQTFGKERAGRKKKKSEDH